MAEAAPRKVAVLVTGPSEAGLRRFLARYVKPAFGMVKNQWRMSYRERYALTVISRPLRSGQDAAGAYAAHAGSGALVLAALDPGLPGSGRDAARAWLAEAGFEPVVELAVDLDCLEADLIDQGALVVNFVNAQCPWRVEPIEDLDAYVAKNSKPFWA
ncbi:MAG: hypothetical protein HY916_01960 [Desulfovibrio sp.]|jgi:hypothetical protein|nr:hypothetical protein [Desulfovibrio sp.]